MKQPSQSLEAAMGVVAAMPKDALSKEAIENLYAVAYSLYNNGKYQDAANCFRILMVASPKDARHLMGLGASQHMLQQFQDAANTYALASFLDKENPYPHLHAAECYWEIGKTEIAFSALESARQLVKQTKYQDVISRTDVLQTAWQGINKGRKKIKV
jgi:type III secretion system low calcium response chaperone LcrH/SycD